MPIITSLKKKKKKVERSSGTIDNFQATEDNGEILVYEKPLKIH